ncbi:ubiquitin conjugating enzyme [Aspergillus terreus]|uniref:Ubiquitin conjugating enzyme n=1 Tax=Aspergillus terreus TaxID=33178 RepID=A0A5M3YUE4_ASPTE|nr:hypothetical protein ATETN484_0003084400 [Aspergillus terreus]GFF14830.1 ubiquitin conjugating enzyme [Aspergillus terreus]
MVVSSLVRRGVEFAAQQPEQPNIHFSGWLLGLFIFTVLAFCFALFKIDYTYGMVVATLAAVEETNPDIYVRIDANLDPTKPIDPNEVAAEAPPPKPITSKLRTTIRHLRARAGFWSRFRGLSMFLTYVMASSFLYAVMPVSMNNFLGQFVCQTIIGVVLANLQLAWVHIVISEPSPKRFYQRIPGYKAWLRIAPVVAFEHFVVATAFYVPLILTVGVHGWKFLEGGSLSTTPSNSELKAAAGAMVAPCVLSFLVSIPARAIFLRVAASMLPDEDEAIVPFDRSFGGKVVPAILGGSGKLSIRDAWKTFDGPARMRYCKVIAKVFAMEVGVSVFFSLLLAAQVYAGAVSIGSTRN